MPAYTGYRWDSKKTWTDKLGKKHRGQYVKITNHPRWKKLSYKERRTKPKHLSRKTRMEFR